MMRQSDYDEILRFDFSTFIARCFEEVSASESYQHNWHVDLLGDKLQRCLQGESRRLIINIPPRYMKSICASVAFTAWLLGHKPKAQIICASYGQSLADKHARDTRAIMERSWYKDAFPTRLNPKKSAVEEFATMQGGMRMATSVGGVLTGRGADFLIIDDPLKPSDAVSESQRTAVNQWYDSTLYSRLNDKKTGCIIIIMQRLHEDDLTGHVLAQEEWEQVVLPAIAEQEEEHSYYTFLGKHRMRRQVGDLLHPAREPIEVLERQKLNMGEYHFAGQYQQTPAPAEGGIIKKGWLNYQLREEWPATFDYTFQSWDTANKVTEMSDYSVCTTWGKKDKRYYLLHVLRRKMDYPELKRAVIEQRQLFRADYILIEDKASGVQLNQELKADGIHGVKYCDPPTVDKAIRLHTQSISFENGAVVLPSEAPWLADYVHELTTFPGCKHDDQVDSTTQALNWVKNRKGGFFDR